MTTLKLNQFSNYVTDDPAEINFGSKFPDGPPTQVRVVNVMNFSESGQKTILDLNQLSYVATVKGGLRNPDAKSHRYTTEHQTYHLYLLEADLEVAVKSAPDGDIQFSRGQALVIVSVNGSGNHWMMVKYCDQGNSLFHAVQTLPNCVAHDLLRTLFDAYENGHKQGTRSTALEYKTAFVNGRLKKRKNRGEETYKVFIESPPLDMNKPIVVKVGGDSAFD